MSVCVHEELECGLKAVFQIHLSSQSFIHKWNCFNFSQFYSVAVVAVIYSENE